MKVLDPCCGSKMFWFDQYNDNAIFGDIRKEKHILCDGRTLIINPDIILDFCSLPFADKSFRLVVFDPPHLHTLGKKSWMAKKYGILGKDWREDIRCGFLECFRVLKEEGILIFKWSEIQIKVNEILQLTDKQPLFGNRFGKRNLSHWICFMNI